MNLFDRMQRVAQSVVVGVMGYNARWLPAGGYREYSANVLFNEPSAVATVGEFDYRAIKPRIEFFINDFPGLLERLLDGHSEEIRINGELFIAFTGEAKFEGKTIVIYLNRPGENG